VAAAVATAVKQPVGIAAATAAAVAAVGQDSRGSGLI